MPTLTTLLIVLAVLILLFLLFREVNLWYWKINKIVSLLEEQNSLLRNRFEGGSQNSIQSNLTNTKSEEATSEFSIPEIKSQSSSQESSFLGGSFENIQIEFMDGIIVNVYHKYSKDRYYFKEKRTMETIQHQYDSLQNCINAAYYHKTNGKILEVGHVGSYT